MPDTKTYATLGEYPIYDGDDLGLTNDGTDWKFKVWSPIAEELILKIYDSDTNLKAERYQMELTGNVWQVAIDESRAGDYYTFQAKVGGTWRSEVVDPYVKVVGVNGKRGVIAIPQSADPDQWREDVSPQQRTKGDIILYELHVRDFSIDATAGSSSPGGFLAFTEEGTGYNGLKTGIDHLVELGVTHVHLLPSFDFRSMDESQRKTPQYNWGYDPQNYNVPEGSYSSDSTDPLARIREFKQMVQNLHAKGLRVVLDVVYNHTGFSEESTFNQLVPNYYYRQNLDGSWSDATACGNETASERWMMRKFIIESVKYWVNEYHIDGFRFDLMGVHDIETMNMISSELRDIDPTIFIYGEGWTAGPSPLPEKKRAVKANTFYLNEIAAFSDDLRDGLKGNVFQDLETGFVSGNVSKKESVKFGIVASTEHPDVGYNEVNYSNAPWSPSPTQCINYVSCHDNLTLWDKLTISQPNAAHKQLVSMSLLANTIVLTSQGVPFLHSGVEFLRSKSGDHNSYQSPDSVNSIKWNLKEENYDVFSYYKKLISLRKEHPAFRMTTTEQIRTHLEFMDFEDPLLLGYWLKDHANGDQWDTIGVVFNGSGERQLLNIKVGQWSIALDGTNFANKPLHGKDHWINPKSAFIFYK